MPLAETYQDSHPFLGVVLAGEFTEPSLEQFKSNRFNLIYCSYETMLQAFASEGLDVASEEDTSDGALQDKVVAFERLNQSQREQISAQIREVHSEQFRNFFNSLRNSLRRRVEYILVLPLYGSQHRFDTIDDAVQYISSHESAKPPLEFVKYELNVRYSNGDEIRGIFHDKEQGIEFLRRQALA